MMIHFYVCECILWGLTELVNADHSIPVFF